MIAIAVAACSPAGAEPAVPAAPPAVPGPRPAGWKQLPAIATAVGVAAKADGVTIDAVDAWGEPARGCYAVWLDLHGGTAAAPALADQVLASLRQAAARVDEVVRPGDPTGALAFRFARTPYRGRVRAQLGNGRIAAIACFGNQREPLDCDASCATVLSGGAAIPGATPRATPSAAHRATP